MCNTRFIAISATCALCISLVCVYFLHSIYYSGNAPSIGTAHSTSGRSESKRLLPLPDHQGGEFERPPRDAITVTVSAMKMSSGARHAPTGETVEVMGIVQNENPEFTIDRSRNCVAVKFAQRQTVLGTWRKVGQPRTEIYEVPLEGTKPKRFMKQVFTLQEYEHSGAARIISATITKSGHDATNTCQTADLHIDKIPLVDDIAAAIKTCNDTLKAKYPNHDVSVEVTGWILTAPGKKTEVLSEERKVVGGDRSQNEVLPKQ